jgi:hypothetical protein
MLSKPATVARNTNVLMPRLRALEDLLTRIRPPTLRYFSCLVLD